MINVQYEVKRTIALSQKLKYSCEFLHYSCTQVILLPKILSCFFVFYILLILLVFQVSIKKSHFFKFNVHFLLYCYKL